MAQGFWKMGMNKRAVFEMFFRKHPFNGGFSVFAGLGSLLEKLKTFAYSAEDISYLHSLGIFEDGFLDYLKGFCFCGSLSAFDEGAIVFPDEPIIRVDGGLIECQIIESLILNTINFQSLIATKTARVYLASGNKSILEFGLRRAQGPDGALSASRAAFIGGASATSNVLAGKVLGIPVLGTMAHSWVMSWPSEEDSFRAFAEIYPDRSIFLIDTYDTLKSGIVNAIKVGKTLAAKGKKFGVRLDSGDLHYLSMEVRKKLDEAGLHNTTISVTNDLDEYIIKTLTDSGVPIDVWGVGTRMVTGGTEASFPGVYKLTARDDGNGGLTATMKFSDNPEKTTNPGFKQVWRVKDTDGMFVADVLALEDQAEPDIIEKGKTYTFWHPSADYRRFSHTLDGSAEPLLTEKIKDGKQTVKEPALKEIQDRVKQEMKSLDQTHKRLLNPHIYKVSITERLRSLKLELIKNYIGES